MTDSGWFDARTSEAPEALRSRARQFFDRTAAAALPARLAAAGSLALTAARGDAARRNAALDLLAADALITLALLAQAELAPDALAAVAQALRSLAITA